MLSMPPYPRLSVISRALPVCFALLAAGCGPKLYEPNDASRLAVRHASGPDRDDAIIQGRECDSMQNPDACARVARAMAMANEKNDALSLYDHACKLGHAFSCQEASRIRGGGSLKASPKIPAPAPCPPPSEQSLDKVMNEAFVRDFSACPVKVTGHSQAWPSSVGNAHPCKYPGMLPLLVGRAPAAVPKGSADLVFSLEANERVVLVGRTRRGVQSFTGDPGWCFVADSVERAPSSDRPSAEVRGGGGGPAPAAAPTSRALECKLTSATVSFGVSLENGRVVGGWWHRLGTHEIGAPRGGTPVVKGAWTVLEIVGDDVPEGTRVGVRWAGETMQVEGEQQEAACTPS